MARPTRPGHLIAKERCSADMDAQLAAADLNPIKRLELMQDRCDLDNQLAAIAEESDMTDVEADFITHAASYAKRKGIKYATWREAGIPAALFGASRGHAGLVGCEGEVVQPAMTALQSCSSLQNSGLRFSGLVFST